MNSRTLTVLFADVSGRESLYQSQGNTEAHRLVSDFLQCIREIIELHDGVLLRTVGDALLASFSTTDSAYLASMAIQKAHQLGKLSVSVGFYHGDVVSDNGDVFGEAVNLAARVAAYAKGGEICTTKASVAQLSVQHQSNTQFFDTVEFRGINRPMSVFRVNCDTTLVEPVVAASAKTPSPSRNDFALDVFFQEQRYRIDTQNPVLTLGRAEENDITIDIECASRNHARIELAGGRFVIHDSSTNGTYLSRVGVFPELILREQAPLDNSGSVGLGFKPDTDTSNIIEFEISPVLA